MHGCKRDDGIFIVASCLSFIIYHSSCIIHSLYSMILSFSVVITQTLIEVLSLDDQLGMPGSFRPS
jgi:hypothetical protein